MRDYATLCREMADCIILRAKKESTDVPKDQNDPEFESVLEGAAVEMVYHEGLTDNVADLIGPRLKDFERVRVAARKEIFELDRVSPMADEVRASALKHIDDLEFVIDNCGLSVTDLVDLAVSLGSARA